MSVRRLILSFLLCPLSLAAFGATSTMAIDKNNCPEYTAAFSKAIIHHKTR